MYREAVCNMSLKFMVKAIKFVKVKILKPVAERASEDEQGYLFRRSIRSMKMNAFIKLVCPSFCQSDTLFDA